MSTTGSAPSATGPAPDLPTDPAAWAAVVAPQGPWARVVVVDATGSTNADLTARAESGGATGTVLVAQEQSAGRGRLDRVWSAPRGSGLTFSVLVDPTAPRASLGWVPLLAGLAVAEAVESLGGIAPMLKWPNDVVVVGAVPDSVAGIGDPIGPAGDQRKLAGLLAHVTTSGRLVVGVGLNTHLTPAQRPVPDATSLAIEGVSPPGRDRVAVLRAVLLRLAVRLADVDAGPTSEAMGAYRARCASLGTHVRVERAGQRPVDGMAVDVSDVGALVIDRADGRTEHLAAGDVVHLR